MKTNEIPKKVPTLAEYVKALDVMGWHLADVFRDDMKTERTAGAIAALDRLENIMREELARIETK